jgi:hypothetical protein
MDWGDGLVLPCVVFDCPSEKCQRSHVQAICYSDEPHHRIARPTHHGEGTIGIWQRTSGDTIDTITIEGAIVVISCDGLHGFVLGGAWCPC